MFNAEVMGILFKMAALKDKLRPETMQKLKLFAGTLIVSQNPDETLNAAIDAGVKEAQT